MALISLQAVSLGFGGHPLLDRATLQIEAGEMIGLLGRNGAGKSTLLKLLMGDIQPDEGQVARQQNLRMAFLPQEVPQGLSGSLASIVAGGLDSPDRLTASQESWQHQIQVEMTLSRMELDPDARFELLSAGMKRRAMLARGLVRDPQLLLLDEPTNHLDIEAINWLEDFLQRWGGTLLFVTHDRTFLQKLSRRIVELDRGRLFDWNCSYSVFLQRKEAMLAAEAEQNALFDKKLAQEEQWIRKGIEARRTRNEGRVRALKSLRETRRERIEQPGKVKVKIQEAKRSGRLVLEAEGVGFSFGNSNDSAAPFILRDFSTTILRGDKVGIVGSNGSGKTTLLRILLGEIKPQTGEIRYGTNLEIAYFDQLRAQLDENQSVLDNVGQGSDTVVINGRTRNLIGYLEDFLFSPDRVRAPISALSGGERNRLLLARLFAQPTNLLVMDEPTNDLDIETLELLEDRLLDFEGTLLLVSHDRTFLNNLVTSTLVLGEDGRVREFVGGYDDWQRLAAAPSVTASEKTSRAAPLRPINDAKTASSAVSAPARPAAPRKLSYQEQRQLEADKKELAELPERIEALEAEQSRLAAEMASPAFYQRDSEQIARAVQQAHDLEETLAQAYLRWETLEKLLGRE